MHLLHARSPEPSALPLVLTHGWPGSVDELLDVVGPLSDPRAHGADPADAFHVVVPSLPGYGLSGPTRERGWDAARVAAAWAELMRALGYEAYGAQGGDWGSAVSRELGRREPQRTVGVHLNMLHTPPPRDPEALAALDARDRERLDRVRAFRAEGSGYMAIQATRPQTLAYALTDSPVGLLAWIAEKFHAWSDRDAAGGSEAIPRDRLLTTVTLYWVTRTAGSAARLYYEQAHAPRRVGPRERGTVPTGVAVFPREIAPAVRALAEAREHIVHWTEMPRGGHFAALEEPGLLVDDVRAFFRALR